jgi:hypothetical protein
MAPPNRRIAPLLIAWAVITIIAAIWLTINDRAEGAIVSLAILLLGGIAFIRGW